MLTLTSMDSLVSPTFISLKSELLKIYVRYTLRLSKKTFFTEFRVFSRPASLCYVTVLYFGLGLHTCACVSVCDWPVSVYKPHTLRAHVTVGGQDSSGRVDSCTTCRNESIHARYTLLGSNNVLLWIITLLTHAWKHSTYNMLHPLQTCKYVETHITNYILKKQNIKTKMAPTKHENRSPTWNYSHDVNLPSSCETGLPAFCEGDASLDAQASREQPAPLREYAPVVKKKK